MELDINWEKYFKRIDQSKIHPLFLAKCKELIKNCVVRGKSYHAISGFRDPIEQEKLYAQGREDKSKPIVTNAKGFKSYHNYGLAIDFCWDKDQKREGLQPGWEPREYIMIAEEAEKLGLLSGLKFSNPDGPHIQIPMNVVGLAKLEEIYKKDGLEACWAEVTRVLTTSPVFKKKWATDDSSHT